MKYNKRKWLKNYGPNFFNLMTVLVGEAKADDLFVKMWVTLISHDKLDKDQIHLYALRFLGEAISQDEDIVSRPLTVEYLVLMGKDDLELLKIIRQYLDHEVKSVDSKHMSHRRILLTALSHKRTHSAGIGQLHEL